MIEDFTVPDEWELIDFFGVEPTEKCAEDGYWMYEIQGEGKRQLRFSFNIFEKSIQTNVLFDGVPVIVVSHEGARDIRIDSGCLKCEFIMKNSRTTLIVKTENGFYVRWNTLRTE